MRTTKEARKTSRRLLSLSFTDGKLDQQKVNQMVQTVLRDKPRHYGEVLQDYQRLLRLEVEKRHAVVESATALNSTLSNLLITKLKARYGDDLTIEFKTNSNLLGGLRVKLGDDVWDGSVRNRLRTLQEQI
ncbi:MAG: F0F1 ATP synthase subunit delta [Verrucomicrobia bacterium]|nr:F0F1 ATP synthase subunit delta [Verrucomicrobiota bacterium]MBV9273953.1 F0F1 ATP synthase subunit delta [Verrucomicrobiota bacterium]